MPKPPDYLEPATRAWFSQVVTDYELEPHHLRLLTLAAESWDRGQMARLAIQELGITYTDRFGAPRKRPEVSIEAEARIAFAKILRELDLDLDPPSASSRPPALQSNRRT